MSSWTAKLSGLNLGDKWSSLKTQATTLATYVKTSVEKQLENSEALAALDAEELGIAYITDRVLSTSASAFGCASTLSNLLCFHSRAVMPFPSSVSTHLGKPIDNLSRFLKTNYKSRFMIWNLAEKTYDYSKFDDQVPCPTSVFLHLTCPHLCWLFGRLLRFDSLVTRHRLWIRFL
jgi:hypothetical protein